MSNDEDSFACMFREDILICCEDTSLELFDILTRVIFVEFAEFCMWYILWEISHLSDLCKSLIRILSSCLLRESIIDDIFSCESNLFRNDASSIIGTDTISVDNHIKILPLRFECFPCILRLLFSFFCDMWIICPITHLARYIRGTLCMT